jgi:hypothetical protein
LRRSILFAALLLAAPAASAQEAREIYGLKDRTIGFVLNSARWGIHQTADGKQECPNGFNMGPRDQIKALYPEGGTVEGTQLAYESWVRNPMDKEDNFPYHEIAGKVGYGLDLDGKVDADDFTSPEGEKGIDNNFYRAIGCLSLENDDQVVVSMYRGKDNVIMDVNGKKVMPGASNRVDDRWGKKYTHRLKGKIENGVLTTAPADVHWAWSSWYSDPFDYQFKQGLFRLKLDPAGETAEGLFAGYADIDTFRQTLMRGYSTHHSGYGDMSQLSMARALFRNADGSPGVDGKNTAISASLLVKFTQVFIVHPAPKVATMPAGGESPAAASRR